MSQFVRSTVRRGTSLVTRLYKASSRRGAAATQALEKQQPSVASTKQTKATSISSLRQYTSPNLSIDKRAWSLALARRTKLHRNYSTKKPITETEQLAKDAELLKRQNQFEEEMEKIPQNPLRRFARGQFNWRDTSQWVPLSLTLFTVSLFTWFFQKRVSKQASPLAEPVVNVFRLVPTRVLSRMWGWLVAIPLPGFMRSPVFRGYSAIFGANLEEVEKPLHEYKSVGDFFIRNLKPGTRPICNYAEMVSPVDGTVLHYGHVDDNWLEQIKGVYYSLESFLGPDAENLIGELSKEKFYDGLQFESPKFKSLGLGSPDSSLFYMVIYLAPGDYHAFHSPVDWRCTDARHFPGDLFSVSPVAAKLVQGLFSINERVVLAGHWPYGFFSFSPVGAYNVGSIEIKFDKSIETNKWGQTAYRKTENKVLSRGEQIGFFHMGSTVVMIFEAPDFVFRVGRGQKVKMGEMIGEVPNEINGRRLAFERIYTRRWLKARQGTAELAGKTYKELFNEAAAAAAHAVRSGAATLSEVTPPMTPSSISKVMQQQEQLKDIMALEDTMTKTMREKTEREMTADPVTLKGRTVAAFPGAEGLDESGEFQGVKYRLGGGATALDPKVREQRIVEDRAEWWHRYREAQDMEDNDEEFWASLAPEDQELANFEGMFGGRWPPSRETHHVGPPKVPSKEELAEMRKEAMEFKQYQEQQMQQRQPPK